MRPFTAVVVAGSTFGFVQPAIAQNDEKSVPILKAPWFSVTRRGGLRPGTADVVARAA